MRSVAGQSIARRRARATKCESLEIRRLFAVTWDAGGDAVHWNDALNWSNDLVPTSSTEVVIATGDVTVSDAPAFAKTLSITAPLHIEHQSLTVSGDVVLAANANIQTGVLSINGDLTLASNVTLFLNIGYSNPGSILKFTGNTDRFVLGNGTINSQSDDITSLILNDTQDALGAGQTLAIASGISVIGADVVIYASHAGTIINNGHFDVVFWSFGNYTENFVNGQFLNYGTISMSESSAYELVNQPGGVVTFAGGTDYMYGNWDNNGTFNVTDASLLLYDTFTMADVGTFHRTGGAVYVGGTLDNIGHTLTLTADMGAWGLIGTLLGGTYSCTDGNDLVPLDGTFNGVTVNSPITIAGGTLHVLNNLTLNSSITMAYGSTDHPTISFEGAVDQTLGGTGSINSMSNDSFSPILNAAHDAMDVGKQLTIGSGITITGPGLTIYGTTSFATIVNNGTLQASRWYIGSDAGTFINNGTITGDTFLQITNLHNMPGHTITVTSAAFYLDGSDWHNQGTISVTDSDLALGGSFAWVDVGNLIRSGTGSTHLFGILHNTMQTLTLNAVVRDLYLDGGGLIEGGTVAAAAPRQLFGAGGSLDGVTLNCPMSISGGNAVFVTNGLTLNSTMTLGNTLDDTNAALQFGGTVPQTLGGNGSINVVGGTISYFLNFADPSATLTIGSGIHMSGKYLSVQGAPILNDGALSVDAGGAWSIGGGYTFENHGTVSAGAGAFLSISDLINAASGVISVAGGAVFSILNDSYQNAGVIDLNGAMIVDFFANNPLSAIQAQLATGFAGGSWTGSGIRSSAAAAANGAAGLGYAESSALFGLAGGIFAGQFVDASSILVRYTLAGDANIDGAVNTLDFNALAGNFNKISGMSFGKGDFNYDGNVNALDFSAIAKTFGTALPAPAAAIPALFGEGAIRDGEEGSLLL